MVPKVRTKRQRRRSPFFVAVLVLFGGTLILLQFGLRKASQLRAPKYHTHYRSTSGQLVTAPLSPIGKTVRGVELFYMLPSADTARGVLIYFHGCQHQGEDMFRLPEDRVVALAALNRGLAVISPTSSDRDSGCWSESDIFTLPPAVAKLITSIGLSETLPRIAIGASSGGSFLFSIYRQLQLKAIVSYIAGRGFESSSLFNDAASLPATGYVHMPSDSMTASSVSEQYSALNAAGVETQLWEVQPQPLTPEHCDQRLPEFGDRRCHGFLKKSKQAGLVGPDNRVLQSYTDGAWDRLMEESKIDTELDLLRSTAKKRGEVSPVAFSGRSWLRASLEEVIAACYARHEMTAIYHKEVLDFLILHAAIDREGIE